MNMTLFSDISVHEGEDDKEDSVEDGVHRMQVPQTAANQALQTL